MGNIALQLERTLAGSINAESNVIFELMTHSTGNITYDIATGFISFMETGRYVVHWFVVTQSSNYMNGVVLALT